MKTTEAAEAKRYASRLQQGAAAGGRDEAAARRPAGLEVEAALRQRRN